MKEEREEVRASSSAGCCILGTATRQQAGVSTARRSWWVDVRVGSSSNSCTSEYALFNCSSLSMRIFEKRQSWKGERRESTASEGKRGHGTGTGTCTKERVPAPNPPSEARRILKEGNEKREKRNTKIRTKTS